MAKGRQLAAQVRIVRQHRLSIMLVSMAFALSAFAAGEEPSIETPGLEADTSETSELPIISSSLPAEAPKSLFSAKLDKNGGDDAELYIKGLWSAELSTSLVLQNTYSGGPLALSSASPLLFKQEPDVFLSFLLFKKLFVEAKVSGQIEQARYSAGYRGGEDELVKEVRIGNDGISFPSIPFLSFGEGSYRSFGAAARIESENFTGRAMIRYDQAERVTRKFIGASEVLETHISPEKFISGKYFVTYSRPAQNLEVYVQSSSGSYSGSDGNWYRKLGSDEYSYSSQTGFISLKSAASTRVLASYSGSDGGSDPVTLNDVISCDLLYEPPPEVSTGTLDPRRQVLCRYATTADPDSSDAYVLDTASGQRDTNYEARIDESGYIEVIYLGVTTPNNVVYRMPFAGDMEWLYITDFSDPEVLSYAAVFSRMIVVRTFSAASSITIDEDVIAGSVEVRRNGVQDYSFTVDTDNAVVKLATPPGLAEEIEVTYLRESSQRKSGVLSGALGGFWKLGEDWDAWAALGTSWSVPGISYASEGSTNPGRITLTGGERSTAGLFTHRASLAAMYSRDDATGRYRIEGMENSGSYASSFRPLDENARLTIVESADSALDDRFPTIVKDLHRDGSTQQALSITAGATVTEAKIVKIVEAPPVESFTTFSFYASIPSGITLSLGLDDGAGGYALQIDLPAAAGDGTWKRYFLRYGAGDPIIYVQDSETSTPLPLASATSSYSVLKKASRIVITITDLDSEQKVLIDELCLEDSIGRAALLAQASADYTNPDLKVGEGPLPWLAGLAFSTDAQGGFSDESFVSGGASLKTTVGMLDLGLATRASTSTEFAPSFRGGHEIALPSTSFPLRLSDAFDYDPSTGSFGRKNSLSVRAGSVVGADLEQKTSWTPPAYLLGEGLFVQEWGGRLSIAGSVLTAGLDAANRAYISASAAPSGAEDYFSTWIGSFVYALPAFESESARRSIKATIDLRPPKFTSKLLALSAGTGVEPSASAEGIRRNTSSMRLEIALKGADFSLSPHYERSWKDARDQTASSLLGDAVLCFEDLASTPLYYSSIPLVDLFLPAYAEEFNSQTGSSTSLREALWSSEIGIALSRDVGSRWTDLIIPSVFSLDCRRELSRSDDQVTDALVIAGSGKWAAVNVFGRLGSLHSEAVFDSDEYLGIMKTSLTVPREGGSVELSHQSQLLATFYAGASDRCDFENTLSIEAAAGSSSWSESLKLSYSRRVPRHFLLDVYRMLVPGAEMQKPAAESQGRSSIASAYFASLESIEPAARSIYSLGLGLDGLSSDESGRKFGWSASESYEARVTVPERVTLKAIASLSQKQDASTGVLSFGVELSLGATISF
jgi:hypothetical protein